MTFDTGPVMLLREKYKNSEEIMEALSEYLSVSMVEIVRFVKLGPPRGEFNLSRVITEAFKKYDYSAEITGALREMTYALNKVIAEGPK